ncbi:uncharacterized transposon-derived protein F54H12.3 [Trichonephila clavipes]|uniref:Uncharacterized transposon-derived protein F54H12.3 n=1 Tax=Trichonephila clavipes TaxID=2585209 RepID=A0A8X7B844_TRICX|nr:uncharacterized transposon-derived protein F54H12.3 [Trichonephila clavipes]
MNSGKDRMKKGAVVGGCRRSTACFVPELTCFVPTEELSCFVPTDELSCFVPTDELSYFVSSAELSCSFLLPIIAVGCIQQEKNMVMSETHSEKRKFGKAGESSVNKKARREISKKYGKFTEDCIPDGVFQIGDDVFVFTSTYYDSISVHIRRFKKYGKTYYPTPEAITLDLRWIEYIMRKKKVPESLEELPSGLFPPERHIQITSENYIDLTFKRIKYGSDKEPTFKEITISREHSVLRNPEVPNSFGGVEAFHRSVKGKYSKKDVKHWLSQKDAYTLHKPVRHKFQRNRVFVNDIDRHFQADLVDMLSLAEFNKGYKYLLTCIDLFSKFAWAVPLKDKFGKSVKSGLEIIFKERKPKVLQTDAGKEFLNKIVQNYLKI